MCVCMCVSVCGLRRYSLLDVYVTYVVGRNVFSFFCVCVCYVCSMCVSMSSVYYVCMRYVLRFVSVCVIWHACSWVHALCHVCDTICINVPCAGVYMYDFSLTHVCIYTPCMMHVFMYMYIRMCILYHALLCACMTMMYVGVCMCNMCMLYDARFLWTGGVSLSLSLLSLSLSLSLSLPSLSSLSFLSLFPLSLSSLSWWLPNQSSFTLSPFPSHSHPFSLAPPLRDAEIHTMKTKQRRSSRSTRTPCPSTR